jgi:hypothetical protein
MREHRWLPERIPVPAQSGLWAVQVALKGENL